MAPSAVHRALSPETNGNAADASGRQIERSPSKALTDAYAQPSKIPKLNQPGTSTGSLHRQASRGIQCCPSQFKLDLCCKPACACMMQFSTASMPSELLHGDDFLASAPHGKHEVFTHDLLCVTACNKNSTISVSSLATQCCTKRC